MLLTNWLKSIASHCRPFRPRHHRHQRSRILNRYQPALSRRMIGCEELEDRTMLTSVISIGDHSTYERDTGETSFSFSIRRTGTNPGDLNSDISINFTTQDNTATTADNDYVAQSGTLYFSADATLTYQVQFLIIHVNGDYFQEDDETFEVLITNNDPNTTISKNTGIANILNDDFGEVLEVRSLTPPVSASENEYFGEEIASDGDYMVVGATGSNAAVTRAGAAYIYHRNRQGTPDQNDDTWEFHSILTANDATTEDQFGTSVAIHGDTIVIGANNADNDGVGSGAAYVYRLVDSVWSFEEKLIASDRMNHDGFGNDVAIENNTIVVGASNSDVLSDLDAGAAYVFTRTGNSWSQTQKLTAASGEQNDQFGFSVAIHNNEIFVSAPYATPLFLKPVESGVVYVHRYLTDSWRIKHVLSPIGGNDLQRFGWDLTVDGNHLGVISTGNSSTFPQAHLYNKYSGSWNSWQATLISSNTTNSSDSYSIDISDTTLVIGSYDHDSPVATSGTVEIYHLGDNRWIKSQVNTGNNTNDRDHFGTAVTISGSQIIVGAPESDISVENSGQVHVFGPFLPGFFISDVTELEDDNGDTQFQFTIERRGYSTGDLNIESTINFSTIDGTATSASGDYQADSGTLTFSADPSALSQTQTVTVIVNGDEIYEGLEYFYVKLSNPSDGFALHQSQAEGKIEEDDYAIVSTTETDIRVNEADGVALVTVVLDRVFTEDVVLPIDYFEAVAKIGSDVSLPPATVTIPAGQLSTTISIDIFEDNIVEMDENFFLYIRSSENSRTSSSTLRAVIKILNNDQATVSISDAVINENQGFVTLTAEASDPIDVPLRIDFSTQDNTATNPDDYEATSGSIYFNRESQTSETFTIPINYSSELELNESFFVNLDNIDITRFDNSVITFSDNQAEVTIIDDDRLAVSFNDVFVNEDAGEAIITFELNQVSSEDFVLRFGYEGGSAHRGIDFFDSDRSVTIPAGQLSASFSIPIRIDNVVEADESFTIFYTSHTGSGIAVPDRSLTVTIVNDDQAVISIADAVVNESEGSVDLEIDISAPIDTFFEFDYATQDNSATNSTDYQAASGTIDDLYFSQNPYIITIPIVDLPEWEHDESFFVNLSNIQLYKDRDIIFGDNQAEVTIIDDDRPTVSITDVTVNEDAGVAILTVSLDQVVTETVLVDFETANQTATQTDDYLNTSGTLTFNAGELTKTIAVSIVDSDILENTETFLVNLSNLQSDEQFVKLGNTQAEVTILDDDQYYLSIDDQSVNEADGTVTLTVSLDRTINTVLTLDYATINQTATNLTDFQSITGSLSFNPGELTKTITVSITDDNLVEGIETFQVNLANIQANGAAVMFSKSQAEVEITDNDHATLSISSNLTVDEGAGTAAVTVSLNQAVDDYIRVHFRTNEGTAISHFDYSYFSDENQPNSSFFTFNPGELTKTYFVKIVDDDIVETNESFELYIPLITQMNQANVTLLNSETEVTILDNDQATISINDLRVDEAAGTATVSVSIDKSTSKSISVHYTTANQSAMSPDDYLHRSGTINFEAKTSRNFDSETVTKTITVPLINDSIFENDETFLVDLSNVQSNGTNTVIGDAQGEVTIFDAVDPVISINDITVDEDTGAAVLTVSLNKPVDAPVSLDFNTEDGTAIEGDDYQAASGSLVFNPGEVSKTISITIEDTDLVEMDEAFLVNLTNIQFNGSPLNPSPLQSQVNIRDDDQAQILFDDLTVDEADTTVTVTFYLDHPVATEFSFDYYTYEYNNTSSADESDDYLEQTGTITFAPEEISKTVTFTIFGDSIVEPDEHFGIRIRNIQTNDANVEFPSYRAMITIVDDDVGIISINDVTVNESAEIVTLTVTLDSPIDYLVSLSYYTADQTAIFSEDYDERGYPGEYRLGAFTTAFSGKKIHIPIVNDDIYENIETFLVGLTNLNSYGKNIILDNNPAVVTIIDDDQQSINIDDVTINESDQEALITVSLAKPALVAISVDYATADKTALSTEDYTPQSGTMLFVVGEQTKTISVPITSSNQVEVDEKFLINLSNIQSDDPSIIFINNQAEVTIEDDDSASLSITDQTVNEAEGTVTLTVTLDQPLTFPVTVDYDTANQTANNPDDYLSQSGTLTFNAGEQSKTIMISLVDSDLLEIDEKFLVNLFNIQANGANLVLADDQAEVTIVDDDDPYLSISDLTVNETEGTASVIVSLEKPVNTIVSVDFITADQSALNSIDYLFQSGTLIFDPGEQSKTIEISILDNSIVEGLETFHVNLRNMQTSSPDVILVDDQAEITIIDDDQATFSIDDLSVDETAGTAKLKVSLNRPVHTTVSVDFATTDNSASNFADYLSESGTLTFFPGQQSKYITIPILDSSLVEGTEQFFVNLTNIQANGAQVTFADDQSVVTIMDDDQASLSINDLTVNEAVGTATLTVSLDQPVQTSISIDFSTVDQSAFAPDDYLSHSGTLTFNPNEQIKTITISIIDSDLVELDETFLVKLSNLQTNGADILLIDDQAKVTVIDDDQARITINDISVDEHAGTATAAVSLDQPVDSAVSVDFTTADQSANQTNDYLTSAGTLTFNPGEQSKTITISIVDSDLLERDETFLVNLSNIQAGGRDVIFADDQAEVTIIDDETATARVDLRVVHAPTDTRPNGEVGSLPDSVEWVKEWSSYWVEIWVDASSSTHQGIFSAQFNLDYNTEYTSATEIRFGASFTQNQAGSINDTTGAIEGLFAETNTSDLGSNDHLLFARIKFEPLAEDQVELDYSGKNIGPYDLGFNINSLQVHLVGEIPATTLSGQFDGASIYANPYDLNDDDAINFRDLMLFASVYNTIPSESHSVYSWFADLNQSDRVNFKDLIFFASNYGKRKLDHPTIVYPQNFPHAWNNQLLVDTTQGEPQLALETLSQSTADIVLDSVVEHVSPQLSPSQNETLEDIDIQVIDLQGDALGRAVSSTIYIDADAAGYGWFVDTTPGDNSEFQVESQLSLIALPDTDAAGRVDLWSVIMHELGHLLGYEHEDTGLMQDTLPPGVRRLPFWELDIDLGNNSLPEEADSFFLTIQDQTEIVPF